MNLCFPAQFQYHNNNSQGEGKEGAREGSNDRGVCSIGRERE